MKKKNYAVRVQQTRVTETIVSVWAESDDEAKDAAIEQAMKETWNGKTLTCDYDAGETFQIRAHGVKEFGNA